jgi:hypothetical protein
VTGTRGQGIMLGDGTSGGMGVGRVKRLWGSVGQNPWGRPMMGYTSYPTGGKGDGRDGKGESMVNGKEGGRYPGGVWSVPLAKQTFVVPARDNYYEQEKDKPRVEEEEGKEKKGKKKGKRERWKKKYE